MRPSLTLRQFVSALTRGAARGQILVVSAFGMVVFVGLVGSGVDYGAFLSERARLQNALDAASLAGARALASGTQPGTTSAESVARDYLRLHGYQAGVNNTDISVTFSASSGSTIDTVSLSASRRRSTYFWQVLGIPQVTVASHATAQVGKGMFDVIFSFDETSSMDSEDMAQLRAAASGFVDQLQPSTSDPRSSRVGIVQFQGQRRDTGGDCRSNDPPSRCWRDAHALLDLTDDRSRILQVIGGPSNGCPALPAQPPTSLVPRFTPTSTPTTYGCPLQAIGGTGTYIKHGFEIAFMVGTWNLWSTTRGGRADAHKVLVLFTDGENSVTTPSITTANSLTVDAANATKPGADGIVSSPSGLPDDVEIFVVGFFDSYQSPIANTTPPGCPSSTIPSTRSTVDNMLIAASSSRAGTCDHYFPLADRTALPQVFKTVASAIGRARLIP